MSEATVTLRKATGADAPILLDLICALADYEKLPRPDEAAQARLTEHGFGSQPRFETFLAFVDGAPAGYTISFETYSTFLARPSFYLEDLFVLPQYRGYKVGLALFQNCLAEARRRECGRMEWMVLDWNSIAINFYEKLGATRMAEWLPYRIVL